MPCRRHFQARFSSSLLFVALIGFATSVWAFDMQGHRQTTLQAAQQSLLKGFSGFWVSAPTASGGSSAIRGYAGELLYKRPDQVASAYDPQVRHDVTRFYESSRLPITGILNFTVVPGQVVSLGLNTGYRAPKLSIAPAVFLGWSGSFALASNQQVTVSTGAWVGGAFNESPCLDDYGRQYWCMTLTAWDDYQPPSWDANPHYLDLRWSFQFR